MARKSRFDCDGDHSQTRGSGVKLTKRMVTTWFLLIAMGLLLVGVLELLDS